MTDLLVSVRTAVEAEIALAGGAGLIDVKDPSRGSLGRADDATIAAVVRIVDGRRPVSAALGELTECAAQPCCPGLHFVKWGLAGLGQRGWRRTLTKRWRETGPQTVIAGYADWQCAAAPPVDDVVDFACERPGNVLLLDTHCKDPARLSLQRRPTLLDWLTVDDVLEITERCRQAHVRVALAGSLGPTQIAALLPARPDWFAVRGAVCEGADRGGAVCLDKVRALVDQISIPAARCAD